MVLRTSNGSPFLVLAPEPTAQTGIRVEIFDRDNPQTILDVLPDTRNRQWLEELRGVGSGSFDIHALDPKLIANPDLLTYGNLVVFYLNGILRGGFRIEAVDKTQAPPEDDAGRWLTVSGRGPLSIFEDAITYPPGGLGGGTDPRSWTDQNAGFIIRELIAEAQTRGALVGVTTDFTDTDDSNAAPFTEVLTLDEDIGNDYLRITQRHAELAVDVWCDAQLILHYVNTRGIDRSLQLVNVGPTVLELGFDITELTNREVGRITNTALILTPAGLLERVDGGSQTTYNRREGFLSLGNTTSSDTVDKAAAALFAELANPQANATLEILDRAGATPYVDFDVGDWVLAPNSQGALTRQRVVGLSVSETPAGRIRYVPELASVEEELEAKLNRWLGSMAKGAMGGSAADLAEPNVVTTQGTQVIIDSNIGQHLANQPHHDELSDLADVNITGVTDGDLLGYDDGANEWVPVDPATLSAGGGKETSTPTHADGDNFEDGSLHADWTQTLDASVTAAEQNGAWRASINTPAAASTSRGATISRALAGLSIGDSIIGAADMLALGAGEFVSAIELGVSATGDRVGLRLIQDAASQRPFINAYNQIGGFTTLYAEDAEYIGRLIWLAIKWEAANQFGFHVSLDGELWTPVLTGSANTVTPTNGILRVGAWNTGGPGAGAWHFFDVVTSI